MYESCFWKQYRKCVDNRSTDEIFFVKIQQSVERLTFQILWWKVYECKRWTIKFRCELKCVIDEMLNALWSILYAFLGALEWNRTNVTRNALWLKSISSLTSLGHNLKYTYKCKWTESSDIYWIYAYNEIWFCSISPWKKYLTDLTILVSHHIPFNHFLHRRFKT